jgi:hypothetical protein
MTPTRHRTPLPLRITAYLRQAEGPQHYRVIAKHIKAPFLATHRACYRMLHDGRLRWCGEGMYRLPQPEEAP